MSRGSFGWFVLARIAATAGVLLLISFGVFALQTLAPGSPEQTLLGPRPATPENIEAIREQFNLNDPFLIQYATWLSHAVQLDFGTSIRTGEPVGPAIADRATITAQLGILAFILALSIGVPLGILAAYKSRTTTDRAIVGGVVIGVSAPAFASGIFLLYVFAVKLGWFPAYGEGTGTADRLKHLALPAVTLAAAVAAIIVRLTRAAMIRELAQDYVVFARARGESESSVVFRYALRNALVPILTAAGLIFGGLIASAALVEVTFALPGLGALLVDSINFKDIPVVQALAVLIALIVSIANLAADIACAAVDPRIRSGQGTT